ncbi:GH1 family beta-glucosidase [Kineothrix sp. MB12-C1]|uniref:GH1 family beta-glucosidase n=1 Tax=Kineothrix sp. MB12-C1 TaxID=3070215 RepID=UPI0027D2FB79|nr:GH1 family beta-glucosidase [Kineothrix sp. MB12-C1]WMC91548.1 GH1 family beta-glucosidase [Kineothrix sp. MB12-C1]
MFCDDFVWGVASSAYQIEGRDKEDECGKIIWDTFAEAGKTADGHSAEVACDHIHRYKKDYALMRLMGVKAYRFSLNWARILPEGTGRVNEKAIALYRDMVQEMRKNNIEPYITLYHWEFPQALQDKGGWLNAESVDWFAEYARVVSENFSDLCKYFITFNEPQCFVGLGNLSGEHAPGLKLPIKDVFQIAHNVLKAHGKAVINLRKYAKQLVKVGYAPTCSMAYPATDSKEDIEAAKKALFGFFNPVEKWTWNVSWFSDPVFLGHYPEEGVEKYKEYLPEITQEDMKLISQPLDFMGQNIYNGYMVSADADGKPVFESRKPGYEKTAAGWPVTPEAIYWGVRFLYERYEHPMYITENGMSCHDVVSLDGRVHDPNRIHFLDMYLSELQKASDDGVDVKGYFLWTFLDNFEWDKGYTERFGIVHVDFETQKRTVKDSAFWYQRVMETNGKELSINKLMRQILFLNPIFKKMVWGGERLKTEFEYDTTSRDVGECWGISAHPHGDCEVKEGFYKGKKLSELWRKLPGLFGNYDAENFPLLVKMIDAKEDLSIQVHPDDKYAGMHEGGSLGKTECWYVMDCDEDARLVIGHNAETKEQMAQMIEKGEWEKFIREIPVRRGDFIQIDPGTVHAIKGGLMILETQQSSDITYRLYDYGRMVNGKPRKLHLDKSMDVITVPSNDINKDVENTLGLNANSMNVLVSNEYYTVWKLEVAKDFTLSQDYPFMNMSVIEGDGLINGQFIKKGDHFVLPADFGLIELHGKMQLIASAVKII